MAEEVKQDRYQQEAVGENDPLAAFLALKSVTGTHNTPNLRRLGSIIGRSEGMLPPYRGKKFTLIDYFSKKEVFFQYPLIDSASKSSVFNRNDSHFV